MAGPEVIVIGASAGGVTAVQTILRELDPAVSAPIIVVQHLAKMPRTDLSMIYSMKDGRRVIEIEDKMPIEPARVYMASPDYHLLIEKSRTFSLNQDEPIHFSRPSIDVLFESVAEVFGPGALGVLLTGANRDGAEGLCRIKDAGGVTVVQSPDSAEVAVMPKAALDLCRHDEVLALEDISLFLSGLFDESGALRPGSIAKPERGNPYEDKDSRR